MTLARRLLAVLLGAAILTSGCGSSAYHRVHDGSGTLSVEVPRAWKEIRGGGLRLPTGAVAPYLQAAPDIDAYRARRSAPGMEALAVSGIPAGALGQLLDRIAVATRAAADCGTSQRRDYSVGDFTGTLDEYPRCKPSGGPVWLVAARRADGTALVIGVQGGSEAQRARILRSIEVEAETGSG